MVCATLESKDINCWMAPRDIVPGISYAEAIIEAINQSRIFLLIFSSESNKSPHILSEVERAINKGITIIPFRIEDVQPSKSMEYFISHIHWLDAFSLPLQSHIDRLARLICNMRNHKQSEIKYDLFSETKKSSDLECDNNIAKQNLQTASNNLNRIFKGLSLLTKSLGWKFIIIILILVNICFFYYYWNKSAKHSTYSVAQHSANKFSISNTADKLIWKNSIAILPFKNLSSNEDQEYFCDGITEEIIATLACLKDLKVIARTSVMQYKNTGKDIQQIAKELKVSLLLEGSVRRNADQIRITTQLIRAEDGKMLWSEQYNREAKDIFSIQDEVSMAIANNLNLTFMSQTIESLKNKYTNNFEAYENYLKAKYMMNYKYLSTYEEKYFHESVKLAEKAIKLDPKFALGYAGLSYIYAMHDPVNNDEVLMELKIMEKLANLAYSLNPNLYETILSKGVVFSVRANTEPHGKEEFYNQAHFFLKKALEISPNDFECNLHAGYFSYYLGLEYQSYHFFSKAIELNPFSTFSYYYRAYLATYMGDYKSAMNDYLKILNIIPDDPQALANMSINALRLGDYNLADRYLQRAEKIDPQYISVVLLFL